MFHRIYRPNHSLEGIPGFESYRDQINLGRVDEILHLEDIFRTVWSEKRRICAILITSHSSKLQLSRFKMLRKANKQIFKLYVLSFREFLMHLSLNSRSSRKNGVRRKTKYNLAEQQEIKRNRFVSGIFTKGQGGHSIIASHIKVKIGTFFLMVNNCINFI